MIPPPANQFRSSLTLVYFGLLAVLVALPAIAQDSSSTPTDPDSAANPSSTATTNPSPNPSAPAADLLQQQADITAQQQELDGLDAKIKQLTSQQNTSANQAELAQQQLALLNHQIKLARLKLAQLQSSATALTGDLDAIALKVRNSQEKIRLSRLNLAAAIRSLYEHDQISLLKIIISDQTLSQIIAEQHSYRTLQTSLYDQIQSLRQQQATLYERQQELAAEQLALQQLQKAQQAEQSTLQAKEQDQQQFIRLKQAEQARFTSQLTEAKATRQEIEQRIFRLQGLGLELKLTDVLTAARFASSLTGVRPSLLLGILKVETNLGVNLGSGIFPDDMHPDSREPFIRLTKQLQRDPYQSPISRRPRNLQGWGGAMGPAQIMPATWESISSRVAALMGKPLADPYQLADALVAIGLMMADRGATDRAKEIEAVARYMAGPNWQYHLWYANRVLAVAAEYETEGLPPIGS